MTNQQSIYEKLKQAKDFITSKADISPKIGMILGSGLGPLADSIENPVAIRYADIPHFHGTSIEGHSGVMILGNYAGIPTIALQGRFHLYEGYPMDEVVFPTRVLCAMGIQTLVLTNAAGGVNSSYNPCDLMVITDHINLMGDNPLKGRHLADLGPRFPDMSEAYHSPSAQVLYEVGQSQNASIQKGVYAGLLGPTYETPAEVRMLATLGADAVGMSTVPESIAANHLGVRVCGISCITNLAAGISKDKLSHDEVIENSKTVASQLNQLLSEALPKIIGAQTHPGESS